MSYYEEYKQRKQDGVWHFLNRLMYVLFVFVGIAGIICLFLPLVQKEKELVRSRDEVNRQVAEQTELLAMSNRKIDWLKDPEYVETLARDRLDLMKPGETVLRLEPPPSSGAQGVKSQAHPQ